ncbi:MAG: hypothetical protein EXR73_12100 [Myxococcales bacterium]|nr:hypothetical protein [Myxococcales bacterium]
MQKLATVGASAAHFVFVVGFLLLLAVAGCSQGEGERCQLTRDCDEGLLCSPQGECRVPGVTADAAPRADSSPAPDAAVAVDDAAAPDVALPVFDAGDAPTIDAS